MQGSQVEEVRFVTHTMQNSWTYLLNQQLTQARPRAIVCLLQNKTHWEALL